ALFALEGQRGVDLETARTIAAGLAELTRYETQDNCGGPPVHAVAWRVVEQLVRYAGADAKSFLLALARSSNPVARAAASVGFVSVYPKRRYPPDVRARMAQLAADATPFDLREYCHVTRTT